MTTQPALPTFTPRNKRVYRFDPDMAPIVTEVPYADHLDICKAAMDVISRAHGELVRLEAKVVFLERRLDDPELVNHPARDSAWDRLKTYRNQIEAESHLINQAIADIDSHGRHMASADLVWLGNHTSWDVIERVYATEPETRGMATWKTIAANTLPF